MKNIKATISMVLVILTVIVVSSAVFAAKTDYISVEKRDWEDGKASVSNDDIVNITNVVSVDKKPIEHPLENENSYFKYFVVDGSTVLTTLQDDHIIYVDKLEYKDGNYKDVKTYKQDKEHLVVDEETDYSYYSAGSCIKIDEPGEYGVYMIYCGSQDMGYVAYIKVAAKGTAVPTAVSTAPVVKTATFADVKISINGDDTAADAYNIDGSNYFKIRDLAYLLRFSITNGAFSEKRFDVTWDADKKAINLISNKEYVLTGNEAGFRSDPHTYKATECTSAIYKDGEPIELDAYTINGSNYFKIRDIAKTFNIGVTWDAEMKTIGLDTSKDYVE